MSNYTFVQNDTGVELRVTCTEGDGQTPIDLTEASVKLRWKVDQNPNVYERNMTVYGNAMLGVASYVFQAGELAGPLMTFELQITDVTGNTRTSLEAFKERVRDRLA